MQVVRFSDTRTASHRSCSLGKAAGFKSAHVWGFDQLRFWKKTNRQNDDYYQYGSLNPIC
jgi:hypothetical protein